MNAEEYVEILLTKWDFQVMVICGEDGLGFYSNQIFGVCQITVPLKRYEDISDTTALVLRHEVGHGIFDYLYGNSHEALVEVMTDIKRHRFLCFVQRIWYWTKLFRWIRKLCGVGSTIAYKRTDKYDGNLNSAFTRQDNELFCDWYSLFGYKKWGDGC